MNAKHEDLDFNQDNLLKILWKDQLECTIITTNGVHIKGKVQLFDKYVVLIRTHSDIQRMIYKHALSTIITDKLI
ncbi:host factor-I protein [Paenibacillus anaericanus]|uniref:RNA chaperone Hfq n=1 Tax=Paenibacillus anaericanus TaxID=170367 RepID=UPI00277D72AF|nr:RNA chaperone Hfq [Paenibacillus anaericanus]MDQ0087929.1 host factor-I protein [Paenibacillus anaericanus]